MMDKRVRDMTRGEFIAWLRREVRAGALSAGAARLIWARV
jgi:hypothetical protein